MDCNFKIIQLNVNSLQSKLKKLEFEQFLKKHSPDLVMLTETKLNAKNNVFFHGYKIFRNDRVENSGGGTAICYKEQLCCDFIASPKKIKSFECCLVKLKTKSKQSVIFASIYKPPSRKESGKSVPIKIKVDELNEIFKLEKNALFVVGGDFNSHHQLWNSKINSQNGINIADWYEMHKNEYEIALYASKEPTCSRSVNGSHIDFGFLSSAIETTSNINQLPSEPFSDHAAIILQITIDPTEITYNDIKDYKRANWPMIISTIESQTNQVNRQIHYHYLHRVVVDHCK